MVFLQLLTTQNNNNTYPSLSLLPDSSPKGYNSLFIAYQSPLRICNACTHSLYCLSILINAPVLGLMRRRVSFLTGTMVTTPSCGTSKVSE